MYVVLVIVLYDLSVWCVVFFVELELSIMKYCLFGLSVIVCDFVVGMKMFLSWIFWVLCIRGKFFGVKGCLVMGLWWI